jgi:hypothetical protein
MGRWFLISVWTLLGLGFVVAPKAFAEDDKAVILAGRIDRVLGRVVAYGVTGVLTCYAADSGKQLWQIDAHKQFRASWQDLPPR